MKTDTRQIKDNWKESHMKKLSLIALLAFASCCAHATTPFPAKVFSDDPDCFAVAFPWPDQNKSVLTIRTSTQTHHFSLNDLGITPEYMTTAGYEWYLNSIGMFTRIRVISEFGRLWASLFYFRQKDGTEIWIDTHTGKLLEKRVCPVDHYGFKQNLCLHIRELMASPNPQDRETGAIHAGQLRMTNALPALNGLLLDKSATLYVTKDTTREVYYVKEAAEKAIQEIIQKQSKDE